MSNNNDNHISEATPLLNGHNIDAATEYVDPGESVIEPLPGNSANGSSGSYGGAGDNPRKQDEEGEIGNPGDAPLANDRDQQYQGMPEVKKQLKYILPAITVGIFLAAADQSLVASSAGAIASDLRALEGFSWIASAYFLTLTTFQPLYGKLSDIFGRKSCLLLAYTIFSFGCLWCGLARSMNEFIIARAVAGIGGGGMTTVVSILMSDIIPLRERGTWQGIINMIFATGSAIGAPIGGLITDSAAGWRWAFLGQVPICAIAFLSVAFALHLPKTDSSDWKTKLRRVDFLGALTLICAVATLLVGLDQGGNVSWRATQTIVCLVLSVPLFCAFAFVEQKIASEPAAPARAILTRSLFAAYACNFFSFAGWFGVLFYIPMYFQASQALSASQSGIRLIPGIVCGVTGSLAGGIVIQKTGRYYWLTVGAYTLLTIAGIPLLLFTGLVMENTLGIIVGLSMGGLGLGIGVTTSLIALISNAEPKDQAVVTACSYLFRSLGCVLGLSIQSALFQGLLRKNLENRLLGSPAAEEIVRRVRESLNYINELDRYERDQVRLAYRESSTAVFALIILMMSGGMFASFFIREKAIVRASK